MGPHRHGLLDRSPEEALRSADVCQALASGPRSRAFAPYGDLWIAFLTDLEASGQAILDLSDPSGSPPVSPRPARPMSAPPSTCQPPSAEHHLHTVGTKLLADGRRPALKSRPLLWRALLYQSGTCTPPRYDATGVKQVASSSCSLKASRNVLL